MTLGKTVVLSWVAAIFGLASLASYFLVFARYPTFRDNPALNIALLVLAITVCGWNFASIYTAGSGYKYLTLSLLPLLLAASSLGLLIWYCYFYSATMPLADRTAKVGEKAPSFELADQFNESRSLQDFRGSKVLLVFYRGHW